MNQKEIEQLYNEFKIPEELILPYNGPEEFASRFKKCGILYDVNTIYGDSTVKILTNQ